MSESYPSTGICPYCEKPYITDDDSPMGDWNTHERHCPRIKEWERCKE